MESLPDDLQQFIVSGRELEYDSDACEAGTVTLTTMELLQSFLFPMNCEDTPVADEDPNKNGLGCYLVEGIDLVQDSDGGYGSEGLLIWLPLDRRYGAWDSSHNIIYTFDETTTWMDIVDAPARYLSAQWQLDDAAGISCLKPWIHHVYNHQQVHRRFTYPAEWFNAEQTLRGDFVDGVQTRVPRKVRVVLQATPKAYTLHATISHMNAESNWIVDEELSRTLSAAEVSELRHAQSQFWSASESETDYGEPVIIWSLEGLNGKRFRSMIQFYSDHPKRDSVAELGEWILELAHLTPLESHLA